MMSRVTAKRCMSVVAWGVMGGFCGLTMAAPADPLQIAGTYECSGYDRHDGAYKGVLTLTTDESASHVEQGFGAYQLTFRVETSAAPVTYSGYGAAKGQTLALYFANDDASAAKDYGIGLATLTQDQDAQGTYTTTLHKSYYQPHYIHNGVAGRGTESCVKTVAGKA